MQMPMPPREWVSRRAQRRRMSLSFPVQTERGIGQGKMAGQRIKDYITEDGDEPMLYFYMSPYKRSLQTFEALASNFTRAQIKGCQEEVQLREQDFGNFQACFCCPASPPSLLLVRLLVASPS